jgi:putative spermidine/putrescine transport system permease protein
MALAPHASLFDRIWYFALRAICASILLFLIAPILAVIPLSFNPVPYFTYPMSGISLRWYRAVVNGDDWRRALENSLIVGVFAMLIATSLGTLAALGLSRARFAFKGLVMAILISPMAVPSVIVAVGMYYFFAVFDLPSSLPEIIVAHSLLGIPFVVITVNATLTGLDKNLVRAAIGLGAGQFRTFFSVTLPLILPGVLSGALFAFATSWDEVVVVLLLAGVEQETLPRRMWVGVRDSISPERPVVSAATERAGSRMSRP